MNQINMKREYQIAQGSPKAVQLPPEVKDHSWRLRPQSGVEAKLGKFPVGDDALNIQPHVMVTGRKPGEFKLLLECVNDIAPVRRPDATMEITVKVDAPSVA